MHRVIELMDILGIEKEAWWINRWSKSISDVTARLGIILYQWLPRIVDKNE
jgi:hypothetical protein